MANGPYRKSRTFQVARSIAVKVFVGKLPTTQVVAEELGISKYEVTKTLSRHFGEVATTSAGIISFPSGREFFLERVIDLEDKIIAVERREKER